MKKKDLKEAISKTITPQEKQALSFIQDVGVRQSLMSVMDGMRNRGKQIDLASAAQQLSQALQMRGVPANADLQRLISRPKNVPKPPQFMQTMTPPKGSSVPRPPQFMQQKFGGQTDGIPVATVSNKLPAHAGTLEQTAQKIAELEQQGANDQEAAFQKEKQRRMKGRGRQKQQPIPQTGSRTPVNRKSYEPMVFSKTIPPNKMKRENKMIKNRNQLKEFAQKFIMQENEKRISKRILKEEIKGQVDARNLAISLLSEGPLSNVWQGIKSAGSSALGALGQKSGAMGMAKDAAQTDQQQKVKEVVNGLTKTISKVHQQRQKWNSQILKSAEMMNQYHDSVVKAYELYKRYQGVLGPAGNEVNRQINELIDALQNDLMSEVSQIQAMLKSLGKKEFSIDDMLKQHQSDAEEMREREADLNPVGVTSYQRVMPSIRGGAPPPREKMRRLRPETTPKEEAPKSKKEEDKERTQRVQAGDKKAFSSFQDEMKEIEKSYKELTDDLAKRALKTSDKEERKAIIRQMYDLAKSKKEREKELQSKLKGIGIRSKAGMKMAKQAYGK